MRLIPSMDLLGGRVVRLLKGERRSAEAYPVTPQAWVGRLVAAGARRIHLVDLDGAFGKPRQGDFLSFPARFPEVRFQLGGGLRDRRTVESILALGFDAVVGTLAVENPTALAGLSKTHVIAALDLKGERIVTRGWQSPSAIASVDAFKALLSLGFRRALVTDVSRDGTLEGPGLASAAFVAKEGFLVQASGGLKEISDLEPLKGSPGVVGTISGKALLEGFVSLEDPRTRTALEGTV